jgi:hypothetical protein
MTVALKQQTEHDRADGRHGAGRLFEPAGERTLDDAVMTAWGGLALRGSARCLVCGATALRDADDDGPGRAECSSCGTLLF